jgi:hypothetical protein
MRLSVYFEIELERGMPDAIERVSNGELGRRIVHADIQPAQADIRLEKVDMTFSSAQMLSLIALHEERIFF